ncbi:MAG: sugar phosphate nucleotidyltransferase, partial [Desulfocapsaceae bacterium]
IQAIEAGNAEELGSMMSQAQELFDDHLMNLSDELRSPQLHRVLADGALKGWVYGGKGVGSQGDGSVQFVARGERERLQLSTYLREEYGVECFNLDLRKATAVKKAIIPVAGNGTRMFPATKAVKKCFLPIVTDEGVSKPILQLIIEEALSGGIEEIGLVINPADEELFTSFFAPLKSSLLNKLPTHLQQEARRLAEIGRHVTLIPQVEQEGFGHAVLCAQSWVGSDTFMLLLGDHLYKSFQSSSCARQIVDCFNELGAKSSVVGIYKEKLNHVEHYGTVSGTWEEKGVLALSAIKEKPTADYAVEYLTVERSTAEEFFCVNGIYVLTPLLFSILSENEGGREGDGVELELTAALEQLIATENCYGCEVDGEHFDTGLPAMFVNTVSKFGQK